ncbi:MAG: helix-turn-helix domain-containing protein [Clostridia bacterium]|nr:helix-turn-helix domain-containing protein [Clostridia bacterium]
MKNLFNISDFVEAQTVQSVTEQLVEREKRRRKKMQLSQKDLAEKSGVTYASIRRFESIGEISFISLLKIALALDCLDDFNDVFNTAVVRSLKDYKV